MASGQLGNWDDHSDSAKSVHVVGDISAEDQWPSMISSQPRKKITLGTFFIPTLSTDSHSHVVHALSKWRSQDIGSFNSYTVEKFYIG